MRRAGVREREQRVVASGLSDRAAVEVATESSDSNDNEERSNATRKKTKRTEDEPTSVFRRRSACFVGSHSPLSSHWPTSVWTSVTLLSQPIVFRHPRDHRLFPLPESPSAAPFVSSSDSARAVSLTALLFFFPPFRPSAAALSSALCFLLSLPSLPFVRSAPRRW